MIERSTAHSTFVIERALPGRPAYAFRFWSEPEMKARWASCHPDWETIEHGLDFRVGGSEVNRLRTPEGVVHGFRSYFLDIVAGIRIVYAYEMSLDDERISASLATVEFAPAKGGTLMTFTEQAAFLDGRADAQMREEGTEMGFARLAAELERDALLSR
jgi:uncharacterized protein YndB with AHSA1/START domain